MISLGRKDSEKKGQPPIRGSPRTVPRSASGWKAVQDLLVTMAGQYGGGHGVIAVVSGFSGVAVGMGLDPHHRQVVAVLVREGGELVSHPTGVVGLPTRIFWSGPAPEAVRWDRSDRDLYEIVLTHGDLDDVRRLVNRQALLDQWTDLYLPTCGLATTDRRRPRRGLRWRWTL